MDALLKIRVVARMEALKMNAFELARAGPFERNFVNDILNGKKLSVRTQNLAKLAAALRCSVEYLIEKDAPDPVDGQQSPDTPKARILKAVEGADPKALEDLGEAIVVMLKPRPRQIETRVESEGRPPEFETPRERQLAQENASGLAARIEPGKPKAGRPGARRDERDDRR